MGLFSFDKLVGGTKKQKAADVLKRQIAITRTVKQNNVLASMAVAWAMALDCEEEAEWGWSKSKFKKMRGDWQEKEIEDLREDISAHERDGYMCSETYLRLYQRGLMRTPKKIDGQILEWAVPNGRYAFKDDTVKEGAEGKQTSKKSKKKAKKAAAQADDSDE